MLLAAGGSGIVVDLTTPMTLPSFQKPPVVEVVCGILFKSLDNLAAPQLGYLWEKYKPDYPHCKEAPPLSPVVERFDAAEQGVTVEMGAIPPLPRIWFVHAKGNGIVQVQRDRFLHNWKKVQPEDEYPRYPAVIQMFKDRFAVFEQFVAEQSLGKIEPLQYEMTYVNHIPQTQGWSETGDIGKIFPDIAWRKDAGRFLRNLEGINWQAVFTLPERTGRLYMVIRHARRHSDGRLLFQLDITARGAGKNLSRDAMWQWFDTAREYIVRGFADLTGEEVQKTLWGRTP